MNNVYIVSASFDDYDSSWIVNIGIFTNKENAESAKSKWEDFFKTNKSIFDEPEGFKSIDEDEDWRHSDEYYRLTSVYRDISCFDRIDIYEHALNSDIFINNDNMHYRSDNMSSLMKQWDRDWKIKNIIE